MADPERSQSPIPSPVEDPLSDVTRKERAYLVAYSFVGLLVAQLKILPAKVTVFDLDIAPENRWMFVFILGLAITYYLVVFCVYAWADFHLRKQRLYYAVLDEHRRGLRQLTEQLQAVQSQPEKSFPIVDAVNSMLTIIERDRAVEQPLGKLRVAIEFYFPPALALLALVAIGVFAVSGA